MSKILKANEFKEQIAELAQNFRQKIELEVEAFEADSKARNKRIEKVKHPVHGYRFFAETYFPHYLTAAPSVLHKHLYKDLPEIITKREGVKLLEIAPRGSAKSTHISLIFPLWCAIIGAKHYMPIIMDAFEQAAVMLAAIKAEFEVNPRLAYDFEKQMGKGRVWREGEIVTRSNVKIEAFGSGKKIRGRRHGPFRPDLVILDDIENDENVDSPRQREKLERWISKAVLELGPTDGSMDVVWGGTILHFDSVLSRFSKKPSWKVTETQAIIKWPDNMDLWDAWEELHINKGEVESNAFYIKHKKAMDIGAKVNWPANHSLLFLMKKRADDHGAFASEYQNKPISQGNPFQDISFWVQQKRDLIIFGSIDPSLGKKGHGRDPSAILVGGYDRLTGVMDLLEASIRKRLPDIIISDTIALQREYNCHLWFVESIQFQEFLRTSLMSEANKAGVPISAIPVLPYADKNLRIERLQPPIGAGLIRFHSSQRTMIDQLQQWPNADHDDGPDALDMLYQNAVKYAGGTAKNAGIKTIGRVSSGVMKGYRL